MKFFSILYGLCIGYSSAKFFLCKYCKYYIKPWYKDQYIMQDYYGKCSKFFIPNSENEYEYARIIRKEEDKCGKRGKYFIFDKDANKTDFINGFS